MTTARLSLVTALLITVLGPIVAVAYSFANASDPDRVHAMLLTAAPWVAGALVGSGLVLVLALTGNLGAGDQRQQRRNLRWQHAIAASIWIVIAPSALMVSVIRAVDVRALMFMFCSGGALPLWPFVLAQSWTPHGKQ